jgi:restriction system protein
VVTDRGRELLTQYPDRIDGSVLRQFPEFLAFKARESVSRSEVAEVPEQRDDEDPDTPEETIQAAEETIRAALSAQLLERIRELPPPFFERLVVDLIVVDLIVAMGYGGTRERVVQRLGKIGDEGIDGVVNEDPLGLDVVYIQAKRYAPENTIGRERIQQFAGALVGQGASKGVFVTTSSFSRGATEYAGRVPQRIILIDGTELARLMIQYGVGVRTERIVELKRLDLDYFEEPDA